MNDHYLIIGLGKIGLPVTNLLATNGHTVTGVSRSPKADLLPNVRHILANACSLSVGDLGKTADTISHICIIVSPSQSDIQGYEDSYWAISENVVKLARDLPNLQRVVFISSTSVYGQNHGEIIEVNTGIQPPASATAQVLLKTEQLLQHHFGKKCIIIRPSGIYGKERLRLVKLAEKIANGEMLAPTNQWTNRIFDTDLVNVIGKVLQSASPLPVYLATDFISAAMFEVLNFIAKQQGLVLILPTTPPTTGKRLISNLPKNWLQYPDYQAGYSSMGLL